MKVLLCYAFSCFCVIVVAGRAKLQVTMNGPVENCPDSENLKLILSDLKFNQQSDDFTLDGKYEITETINGPISIKITSKKYERGTWVNSMLNQNINDVCAEMAKENRADWLKMFDEWTIDKKCPFIKKEGEYKSFPIFKSENSPEFLPPNFYGKYKSESRIYQNIDGDLFEIGCFIISLELANI